jgi:hydrogenase-4 membrane subunit HyfE
MAQHAAFDAALITSMSEKKSEVRVLAWCSFIIAAVILAIGVLMLDSSLSPDQRITVFQQSGFYP